MNELPKRKPNRLQGYDYSQNGAYFVTICIKNRETLFGRIVSPSIVGVAVYSDPNPNPNPPPYIELSEYGNVVDSIIKQGGNTNVCLDKYIIMPNHIHLILIVRNNENRDVVDNVPYKSLVSTFVRSLKTMTSKQIGFSPWQRSFHDHVIRNERAYRKIADYITHNPVTWLDDCFYVEDDES